MVELELMDGITELESFEPQIRARSNTWPLPRPENYVDVDEKTDIKTNESGCAGVTGSSLIGPIPLSGAKKSTARRNAWGNLSYADLITQAIGSVPEKRLTLSQIYEWMVQNVPYFKDKGDSNSSAGWKNSIRHNLSLHNRFMRVQNEGTGKSSWWMINPDAKPGKSSRRRATSMETSKFEKRRGRVRKKVEALRNGSVAADATPSPSSSVSEGLDMFPDSPLHSTGFQLSPDFRPRASSNASSCGGRLSPIPHSENEWSGPNSYPSGGFVSELAGNLADTVKLQQDPFTPGGYNLPYPSFDSYRPPHYGIAPHCPLHRLQGCACGLSQCARDGMSPAGLSPSYPQSEPSPDPMGGAQPSFLTAPTESGGGGGGNQQRMRFLRTTPSTMMGQLMGALNNTTVLDDLNLNIEAHADFDCNVEEVIKHELSMDGSLDFNFGYNQTATQVADTQPGTYSSIGRSWVH